MAGMEFYLVMGGGEDKKRREGRVRYRKIDTVFFFFTLINHSFPFIFHSGIVLGETVF